MDTRTLRTRLQEQTRELNDIFDYRVAVECMAARLAADRSIDPNVVETAFLRANPQLDRAGIAVTCDKRYLRDVRICMTRELSFRSCEEVDRNHCGRRHTWMPATRPR